MKEKNLRFSGKRLHEARQEKGWSVMVFSHKLADKLGQEIWPHIIYRYESGSVERVDGNLVAAMEQLLDKPQGWLYV